MAKKFKVQEVVGKLEVDLRYPGNPDGYWGLIPEPSQQMVNRWSLGMTELGEKYGYRGDPDDMVAIAEFVAEVNEEHLEAREQETAELYAELCSQQPSTEQLMAMHPRYRAAFYGYITGEFRPEGSTPAGKS